MNLMLFTKTALRNLFSKPASGSYPTRPEDYPERTRGHIEIDISTCIFCGLCSRRCPTGAIRVDRAQKSWSIDRFSCIQCGYCAESCAKHSLTMKRAYTEPGAVKTTDTFVQPSSDGPAPAAKPIPAVPSSPAVGPIPPVSSPPAAKPLEKAAQEKPADGAV